MAGSGYYTPANEKTQWFQTRHPGSFMKVEKVVWHTTEGADWPTYAGGSIAPHFTVKANFSTRKMDWRQHFPVNRSSRALRNTPGGVQTNMDGAVQVEIVGTCDPIAHAKWKGPHLFSPMLTDWQVEGLAQFAVWMHSEHGVPFATPSVWLNYGVDVRAPGRNPSSYGNSPARMTGRNWDGFRGHCGHQHVPENEHGDPGAFQMPKVLTVARGIAAARSKPKPVPAKEDDMPSAKEIAEAVLNLDVIPNKNAPAGSKNPTWSLKSMVEDIEDTQDRHTDVLTTHGSQLTELVGAVKEIKALLVQLTTPTTPTIPAQRPPSAGS